MRTQHVINVQQRVQQILRVTGQAWGLALSERVCGARQDAAVHRRPVCRSQALSFSIAY